jgi:hypothetical protein
MRKRQSYAEIGISYFRIRILTRGACEKSTIKIGFWSSCFGPDRENARMAIFGCEMGNKQPDFGGF